MLLCAQHILPITANPIQNGAILVRDGEIRDIGEREMLQLRYPKEEVKDFGLAALMPGLVDLHTHLESTVMRGIVHDVPYPTWLMLYVEKSGRLSNADCYDSALFGGLEALSAGITCVADIASTNAVHRATRKLGLRSVIYREVGAMDKRRVNHAMKQATTDIARWQDESASPLITIGISPSALYACHPAILGRVAEFAQKNGNMPVAMHLAGSAEEYNFVKYGSSVLSVHKMDNRRGFVEVPPWLPTGTTPIRYALNWGAFETEKVMAVHCVHIDDEDIEKLKEYDVSVALCPRCNAQLGMGVAPMNELLRAKLRMGLGTDSPVAVDSTDMLFEMRIGMLVQRAVNVGQFLDCATMLEMATIGGARALHLEEKIGSLEIGKRADLIAVDLSGSHQKPMTDPVSAVVNTCAAADVLMNMVDGAVLYERGQWYADVEVAKNAARVIKIREKLGK
ncbi:MAG: amidohydrolase family protein [Eggerthellaceae bacterium]|jgi:5-methylthioadenosine/S-adenosylhomocysteine deaminase|nr:amidohydrolase family protein [Eggerthellaceae bacterium]MDR2716124.1 amidohydrolase family protein [Coriobacteriaceae bacterium]